MKGTMIAGAVVLGVGILWYVLWPDATTRKINNLEERKAAGEIHIVAFGDSLTEGYGLPEAESYPAQLEERLQSKGLSVRITNAGVSGETTNENLERVAEVATLNPDVVLLGIGGNDALRSLPVPDIKANIEATVEMLKSGTTAPVVILLQMQSPLNAGISYKREFDAMYSDIANEHDVILLPFLTLEVFLKPEFKLSDGIHLNEAGYAEVIDLYLEEPVTRVVEQLGG